MTSREIAKNAVGAPEIRPEAVRSSELQDETIRLEDSPAARARRSKGRRVPQGPRDRPVPRERPVPARPASPRISRAEVPTCSEFDLLDCPNVQSVLLTAGSWVVQAKFTAFGVGVFSTCGLIAGDTTRSDDGGTTGIGRRCTSRSRT